MPKNKGKGGKNEADDEKRELVLKKDGQEYAEVLRMLDSRRCEVLCIDLRICLCHIRGKMHKKVSINAGDTILVGLRDYKDDECDFILKYMPDEAMFLKGSGVIPDFHALYAGIPEHSRPIGGVLDEEEDGDVNDYIEFEDEDIDKI